MMRTTEFRCQCPATCEIPLLGGPRDLAQQIDVVGFLYVEQGSLGGEIDFLPAVREASGAVAGWRGDPALPISAASDIIGRLGMFLPSNHDVVRPDPDVS
jgi:hypothetical protein